MKTEIKLNGFPEDPPIVLPRLLYQGILNDQCRIALQTGFSPSTKCLCFDGILLYSTIPGYVVGNHINGWAITDWKEFEHTLTLSNK
jgi:hypothetical protein